MNRTPYSDRRAKTAALCMVMSRCPECADEFMTAQGFVGHLICDHWWDRDRARIAAAQQVNFQ